MLILINETKHWYQSTTSDNYFQRGLSPSYAFIMFHPTSLLYYFYLTRHVPPRSKAMMMTIRKIRSAIHCDVANAILINLLQKIAKWTFNHIILIHSYEETFIPHLFCFVICGLHKVWFNVRIENTKLTFVLNWAFQKMTALSFSKL